MVTPELPGEKSEWLEKAAWETRDLRCSTRMYFGEFLDMCRELQVRREVIEKSTNGIKYGFYLHTNLHMPTLTYLTMSLHTAILLSAHKDGAHLANAHVL